MARRFKKPYRIKRKKSIFRNRFFWLSLLVLIFVGGIIYFLIFASYFQVKEIQISGNEKVPTAVIRKFVEEKISRQLIFFPTKSIFLVNLNKISKNFKENFPQIFKVNLKRKFPNYLILEIEERKPLFILCQNSGPCFHLDKEGVVFDPIRNDISNGAGEISESPLIKIKGQTGELKLGKKIIEKEIVDFLQKTQLRLEDLGILTKEFQISEGKITAQTDQDWQIFLNSKEDPEKQIFNLALVFEKEIPPEKRENLEYIDLRFGNRVYYKYRGEPAKY